MHFIKHLRDSFENWNKFDSVIPDGEIALCKNKSGFYQIKVGNGKNKFSELPTTDGKIIESSENVATVTLMNAHEFRFRELTSLTFLGNVDYENDFISQVSFDSGATPTTVVYNIQDVLYSGNSVKENVFVPEESTHYTMIFYYDGRINCQVRGVKLAKK